MEINELRHAVNERDRGGESGLSPNIPYHAGSHGRKDKSELPFNRHSEVTKWFCGFKLGQKLDKEL